MREHRVRLLRITAALARWPVFAILALAPLPAALAQTPIHIRGDVIGFDAFNVNAKPMRVKARDGSELAIQIAFNFECRELKQVDPAQLKPGSYVGVVAQPATGGSLRALAVLLYPDHMRGSGEGHHDWDIGPSGTMTHATVQAVDASRDARTLTLRYAGGEKTIVVPVDAPVVTLEGGGRQALDPGTHVFINATRQRDGTITAGRILFGRNGFTPPL